MEKLKELKKLQLKAKEKIEAVFLASSNGGTCAADAPDRDKVSSLRAQAVHVLEKAVKVGCEIRKACVPDDVWSSRDGVFANDRDDHGSDTSVGSIKLQKNVSPIVVAETLLLIRETHVMLRELFAHSSGGRPTQENMLEAVRHAKEAQKLEQHTVVVVKKHCSPAAGHSKALDSQTMQRLASVEQQVSPHRLAMSEIQIAVLLHTVGQCNRAIKRHRAAVRILEGACSDPPCGGNRAMFADEARELLPVALYNLGCELEHMSSSEANTSRQDELRREMQSSFSRALLLGKQYLDPNHPLLRQLETNMRDGIRVEVTAKISADENEGAKLSPDDAEAHGRAAGPNQSVLSLPHLSQGTAASGSYDNSPRNTPTAVRRSSFASFSNRITLPSLKDCLPSFLSGTCASDSQVNDNWYKASVRWEPSMPPGGVRKRTVEVLLTGEQVNTKHLFTCHRLRRPSDALRLGGVSVEDTLFAQQRREEEKERERMLEIQRRRRKLRRQRSFLPVFGGPKRKRTSQSGDEANKQQQRQECRLSVTIDEDIVKTESDDFIGGGTLMACLDRMKSRKDDKKRKRNSRSEGNRDQNSEEEKVTPEGFSEGTFSSLLNRVREERKEEANIKESTLGRDSSDVNEYTGGDALLSRLDKHAGEKRGTKKKKKSRRQTESENLTRSLFNDFSSGDALLARLGLIGDDLKAKKKPRKPKRHQERDAAAPSEVGEQLRVSRSSVSSSSAMKEEELQEVKGGQWIEGAGNGTAGLPPQRPTSEERDELADAGVPDPTAWEVVRELQKGQKIKSQLEAQSSRSTQRPESSGTAPRADEGLEDKVIHVGGRTVPSAEEVMESDEEESEESEEETEESVESEDSEEETMEEKKERCEIELANYFQQFFQWRMLSALKIQCLWRRYRARVVLHERQQILYKHVYRVQKAAAMCIEGFIRSIVAQSKLRLTRERCAVATEKRIAQEDRIIKSALVIMRYAKDFVARRRAQRYLLKLLKLSSVEELRLRVVAQTIVARWWKLILPRKKYWRRREQEIKEEKMKATLLQIQNNAAIAIQRHCRGHLDRRAVRLLRERLANEQEDRKRKLNECTDLVRLCLQEYSRRRERLALEAAHREVKREEAAAVIQNGWRAALRLQVVHNALNHCRRTVRAVLLIQRVVRRFLADGNVRYLRRLQQVACQDRLDKEYRIYWSTIKLQSFARMVIAKRTARHRRAAIGRGFFYAAMKIQSASRAGTVRMQLGRARRLRIEALELYQWLRHEQKLKIVAHVNAFVRARGSCQKTEELRCRRLTNKLILRRVVRRELLLDRCATIIQRETRRWAARRRQQEAEERERALRALVTSCVTRIQAVVRGFLARRDYRIRSCLQRRQERKREEMEEVAVQLWVDEWRATTLHCEHDRRRIETLEENARDVIRWCFNRVALPPAVAPMVLNNVMRDMDDSDQELDSVYCTYAEEP